MASSGYNPYQKSAVEHADPVKLVGMMYEGALRFIRRAVKCITAGDAEGAHNNIMRAYAIVAELMATLDFERGGEIAIKLEQCYDYVLHLLKEANIKKDATQLEFACRTLEPLLETWNDAFANGSRPVVSLAGETGMIGVDAPDGQVQAPEAVAPELAGAAQAGRKSLDITG
jgi:flagellar secretion chaperone FliS